jgi:hypothetical protein
LASALPQQIVENATLVASELVTDRLRQAHRRLNVVVEAGAQSVTIRVRDNDPGSTRIHADRVGSRRSREIVHHLASSWGYAHDQHGWAAWASLRTPAR